MTNRANDEWRPSPGQLALIEPKAATGLDLTGLVQHGGARPVVDVGSVNRLPTPPCEVVASFYAPDALYRLTATALAVARPRATGLLELKVHGVERVQRRAHSRTKATLPIELTVDASAQAIGVHGETIDLSPGGLRVVTDEPFPVDRDATVSVVLPDGEPVVAQAEILESTKESGRFGYRLAFSAIDDADRERLLDLTKE